MTRTLLVTTALAGLLTTSALAQNAATPAAPSAPTAQNGSSTSGAVGFVRQLEADQVLASNLTGTSIYETSAPDARSLGEIRNFVIGQGGKLAGVVIETSGLDQNKTVAAAADKIDWADDGSGKQRAVLKAPPSELQAVPEFLPQSPQDAAQNGAAVPGSGAAPAGGPADRTASNVTTAPTADTNAAAGNAAGGSTPAPMPDGNHANGYLTALANDQKLSQDVIGSNVYSGPGDDAATIGSVNDLVLTKRGEVPIAVVGVGGFLGIGEKNVGVPYGALTIQPGSGSEPRLVMAASKDQLTAAPTFEVEGRDAEAASSESNATTGLPTQASQGSKGADPATSADNGNRSAPVMNADPSTTASTGTTNDQSSMKPVTGAELTADKLNGLAVYGPNDQSIGKVGDIALTADGRVDAVVVDVGGFLGIGSKPVAVAMENLQFLRDTNGTINIYTQFTQDQLKSAPEFNRETYAENRGTVRLAPSNAPTHNGDAGSNAAGSGGTAPAQ